MSVRLLEMSLLLTAVGTVLTPSRKGCVVDGRMTQGEHQNEYAPPPVSQNCESHLHSRKYHASAMPSAPRVIFTTASIALREVY